MKYEYRKSFERDVKKAPEILKAGILEIIENINSVQSINDIVGVKKMVGFKNAYRIRTKNIKDYRIGFYYEEDTVIISRLLARKEIYKNFP
jgi:mRNA interferase RelE/StbE